MDERLELPEDDRITVPRPALIGAGLLMLFSIVLAGAARFTGLGRVENQASAIAALREIDFRTLPGDSIAVLDHASGERIQVYERDKGGFVTGSLRAFAYDRKVRGSSLEAAPFRLVRYTDGRAVLEDPVSHTTVALEAFGSENFAAFARLLPQSP